MGQYLDEDKNMTDSSEENSYDDETGVNNKLLWKI